MAYSTESFYTGTYSPLSPEYGELFTGYRVPFQRIGATTSIQTANQIAEVSARLSEGVRVVELQPIQPEIFESIPKEHFKEIARLTKLTGAEPTLHAPIIDPAGFTGERIDETARETAEKYFNMIIERAHELNPNGNMPITIHATAGLPQTVAPKPGEPLEGDYIHVIDRETGSIRLMRREKRLDLKTGKEILLDPVQQIQEANKRIWDSQLGSLAYEKEKGREYIETGAIIAPVYHEVIEGKIKEEELLPEQRNALSYLTAGKAIYDQIFSQLKISFNEAMRCWPEEKKKEYAQEINQIKKNIAEIESTRLMEENPIEAVKKCDQIFSTFKSLIKKAPPQQYVFSTDFALEKTKETLSNVALNAFKKFGEKAPILSIENVFPGTVFGRAGELAELIKASREEFVKKAVKEGISESRAREMAEKMIGATWDVGHINLLRKYGFPKEAVAEETKKIAPFVKHVHLTDNFGFNDSHLAPGMGEVPFKEILKELEKAGFTGKEIVEAGGFVMQFKTSPTPYILEALGSPIYGMEMQPFWNQVRGIYGIPGVYAGGYGMMLPEQHFATYGAGFAGLPIELGGTMPGKGQRFAGAPME